MVHKTTQNPCSHVGNTAFIPVTTKALQHAANFMARHYNSWRLHHVALQGMTLLISVYKGAEHGPSGNASAGNKGRQQQPMYHPDITGEQMEKGYQGEAHDQRTSLVTVLDCSKPVAGSGRHSIMVLSIEVDSRHRGCAWRPGPEEPCHCTLCTQSSCPTSRASRNAVYCPWGVLNWGLGAYLSPRA